MVCRLVGNMPFPEPMMINHQLVRGKHFGEIWIKYQHTYFKQIYLKCCLQYGSHFVQSPMYHCRYCGDCHGRGAFMEYSGAAHDHVSSQTFWGPVWLDQNQICILKSGYWNHAVVNKQNVKSASGLRKQIQNLDLIFIKMSEFINFIQTNFIKMSLFCFHNYDSQNIDYELIKHIVSNFLWHLLIAVRHLESNESASGAGFMVSWIQIWF